ncbi:hypothetical protein C0992_011505, partial [Termitomyces sp. T32_za158]
MGMPPRGRLNLLADLLQLPAAALFSKIKGGSEHPDYIGFEGDVLSHLVASPTRDYGAPHKSQIKVSLLLNPSHLEAVNPIALGKTRAKQYALLKPSSADCELGDKVMCVELHGDASFAGQGAVMEGLGLISHAPPCIWSTLLALLLGYRQDDQYSRAVLHVNGDCPEDVVRTMDIAFRYMKYFRNVCGSTFPVRGGPVDEMEIYRHNELDLPGTQPRMYKSISGRRSVPQIYEEKLKMRIQSETNDQTITSIRESHQACIEAELARMTSYKPDASALLPDQWA